MGMFDFDVDGSPKKRPRKRSKSNSRNLDFEREVYGRGETSKNNQGGLLDVFDNQKMAGTMERGFSSPRKDKYAVVGGKAYLIASAPRKHKSAVRYSRPSTGGDFFGTTSDERARAAENYGKLYEGAKQVPGAIRKVGEGVGSFLRGIGGSAAAERVRRQAEHLKTTAKRSLGNCPACGAMGSVSKSASGRLHCSSCGLTS